MQSLTYFAIGVGSLYLGIIIHISTNRIVDSLLEIRKAIKERNNG